MVSCVTAGEGHQECIERGEFSVSVDGTAWTVEYRWQGDDLVALRASLGGTTNGSAELDLSQFPHWVVFSDADTLVVIAPVVGPRTALGITRGDSPESPMELSTVAVGCDASFGYSGQRIAPAPLNLWVKGEEGDWLDAGEIKQIPNGVFGRSSPSG
jgi:hypothetical protein